MQNALHLRILNNFRSDIIHTEMIYEAENPLEIPLPFTIKYGESLGGDHFRVKCLQVGG